MQHRMTVTYRRFGTTYRVPSSRVKESKNGVGLVRGRYGVIRIALVCSNGGPRGHA